MVRPTVDILTTAGVTLSSIGARLGTACPSTAAGREPLQSADENTHSARNRQHRFLRNNIVN